MRGFKGFRRNRGQEGGFEPFEQTFNYTGSIQQLAVPSTGLYKLEVWGACGGYRPSTSHVGGKGGYSVGYTKLVKNEILYIVCGGVGSAYGDGGYNGGGRGSGLSTWGGAGGGGATHIAKLDGLLAAIGYENFVTNRKGLIVAGGGGGAAASNYESWGDGGSGGGLTGGSGVGHYSPGGGTQTGGFAFGQGGYINSPISWYGGGGSGLFGGGVATGQDRGSSGAGGSGYIDGVPEITYQGITYTPSTTNGVNGSNGYATVTRIA